MTSPLSCLDANGYFAVVKNFKFCNFHPNADHAGQLHEPVRQFADQAFKQIYVLGGAFGDDDLAHLAVVEHMADIVVVRQQRLRPEVEFGIDLDRLRRAAFVVEDAEVRIEAQAGDGQGLAAQGDQRRCGGRERQWVGGGHGGAWGGGFGFGELEVLGTEQKCVAFLVRPPS